MVTTGLVISVLVKLYDSISNGDWKSVEKILAVLVIGGLVGYFHFQGIGITDGIVDGLSISGVMTVGGFVASKLGTAPAPVSPAQKS